MLNTLIWVMIVLLAVFTVVMIMLWRLEAKEDWREEENLVDEEEADSRRCEKASGRGKG